MSGPIRLVDLEPRWFDIPGVGGAKDGVTFLCPCSRCITGQAVAGNEARRVRLGVQFANPIGTDKLAAAMTLEQKLRHVHDLRTFDVPPGVMWQRTGESFETLTIAPSVDASASGHWHGFIVAGEVRSC